MKCGTLLFVLLVCSGTASESEFVLKFLRFPDVGTGWVHVDNSQVSPRTNDVLTATVKYINVDSLPTLLSLNVNGTGEDEAVLNGSGTVSLEVSNSSLNSATQFHVRAEVAMPDIETNEELALEAMANVSNTLSIVRVRGLTHDVRSAAKSANGDWKNSGVFQVDSAYHLCAAFLGRSPVGWKTRAKVYNVDSQGTETLITTVDLTDGQADKEMGWAFDVTLPTSGRYSTKAWKLKFKGEAENLSNQQVEDLGMEVRYFGIMNQSPNPPPKSTFVPNETQSR